MTIKIYFEDHGQDFLEWELKRINTKFFEVIDSQPFQKSVWKGKKLLVISIRKGFRPIFDNYSTLNYNVIKIKGFKPIPQKQRN